MKRLILLLGLPASFAQVPLQDNRDPQLSCGRAIICEMREETVAATGRFDVRDIHNGSITVRGWTGKDVKVRTRVEAGARDQLKRIHTRVSPGRYNVDGPDNSFFSWMFGESWSVSVEIFVPHNTELVVAVHNGSIHVSDIAGRVEARSHNGDTRMERLAGDVRVTSHNGTARVDLTGTASSTRRVDAECHNGDITIGMPRGFAASVTTQRHNGSVRSDFPMTSPASNRDREAQEFQIGSGGVRVRARTHNGGIHLRQI